MQKVFTSRADVSAKLSVHDGDAITAADLAITHRTQGSVLRRLENAPTRENSGLVVGHRLFSGVYQAFPFVLGPDDPPITSSASMWYSLPVASFELESSCKASAAIRPSMSR